MWRVLLNYRVLKWEKLFPAPLVPAVRHFLHRQCYMSHSWSTPPDWIDMKLFWLNHQSKILTAELEYIWFFDLKKITTIFSTHGAVFCSQLQWKSVLNSLWHWFVPLTGFLSMAMAAKVHGYCSILRWEYRMGKTLPTQLQIYTHVALCLLGALGNSLQKNLPKNFKHFSKLK